MLRRIPLLLAMLVLSACTARGSTLAPPTLTAALPTPLPALGPSATSTMPAISTATPTWSRTATATAMPTMAAKATYTPKPTPLSGGLWTELGPRFSGRVNAIVATDLNHLWAASAGGGVWKSADGGANWVWAGNNGLTDWTALDLAPDRSNPARMYLRTMNGFWISTDGGANWSRTLFAPRGGGDAPTFYPPGTLSEHGSITQAVFSPSSNVIFTALPCAGLSYSTDSGFSFSQIRPFPGSNPETSLDNCITSIAVDEATRKVYFASLRTPGQGARIWRSTAAWTPSGPPPSPGWELVNAGLVSGLTPNTVGVYAIAWGGSPDRLMVVTTDWQGHDFQTGKGAQNQVSAYLFNGNSWIRKPFPEPDCYLTEDVSRLIWAGGDDFFVGGVTFGYTKDAGDTWTCPTLGPGGRPAQHIDIRAIYASPSLQRVWIGGDQSDLGKTDVISSYPWTPGARLGTPAGYFAQGISSGQAYSVALVPTASGTSRIVVGKQDGGSDCSDDGGLTWQPLRGTSEAQSLIWSQGTAGSALYDYSVIAPLERSGNADRAARCSDIAFANILAPGPLTRPSLAVGPHTIAVQPADPNRIFLAQHYQDTGRIVYSISGGTSWSVATLPRFLPPAPTEPTLIFVDGEGSLYIGTQDAGAFVCRDAEHYCDDSHRSTSGSWAPWGLNKSPGVTPPHWITAIAASQAPAAARTYWMATTDGLYRKQPGATGWTLVDASPGHVFGDIAGDPTCPTRVYAGFGFSAVSRSGGGIDVSSNNGDTWASLTAGQPLHHVPITQIVVDPGRPARVLATTYGRGLWEFKWNALAPCAP